MVKSGYEVGMTDPAPPMKSPARTQLNEGDPFGVHRALEPQGVLPQPAWRVDNDFSRIFAGELLLSVETLNIDAASFRQMEEGEGTDDQVLISRVLGTVGTRGKQHNPVTGSGGMLLGKIRQVSPGHPDAAKLEPGTKIATLVSLSLTPLRIDRVHAVRRPSAQLDVDAEAVLFATSAYARMPSDFSERLALAALDVAGAAPQVARLVRPGQRVLILGAGGKSGILCAAEARRTMGSNGTIIGVENHAPYADELRALGICDHVIGGDARDPVAMRNAVLALGPDVDISFSCVNVPDAELSAILPLKQRGIAYFFAMSTSFTKAALGAEGVGKDVDLFVGNGFALGHADHTLDLLRQNKQVRALFELRYGA
jgi:L-erythro-3,5-diaminohexanoate dehydrogenase